MEEKKETTKKIPLATLKPKQFWDTPQEAQACLKEWQDKLGMNDWHIHLKLTTEVPHDALGYCQPDFTHRFASIYIAGSKSGRYLDNCLKSPHEYILIHELLHCIIPRLKHAEETSEEAWYNTTLHQITERMARALYCAKYGLKSDWFFQ